MRSVAARLVHRVILCFLHRIVHIAFLAKALLFRIAVAHGDARLEEFTGVLSHTANSLGKDYILSRFLYDSAISGPKETGGALPLAVALLWLLTIGEECLLFPLLPITEEEK